MTDQPASGKAQPRRVAVLAVHGVGRHAPGETQNAMVDLLMTHADEFDSFRSQGIQIPLHPLAVKKPLLESSAAKSSNIFDFYQEQSVKFSSREQVRSVAPIPRGQTGNDFTKLLIENYLGGAAGNAYITTRLSGTKKSTGTELDIYEMEWADLANPNNSILGFFLALFQLILHLASLSRLAADTGSSENSGALWDTYLVMQRYAVRMLQIFLPLFKILLLIAIFSAIPALSLAVPFRGVIMILLTAFAGVVIAFITVHVRVSKGTGGGPFTLNPWAWSLVALLPGAIGAAAGLVIRYLAHADVAGAIACWIVLGMPLLYYVLGNYEDVRKGVERTGWVAYGLCFVIFLYSLYVTNGNVLQATFWIIQVLVASIRASWFLLFAFATAASILGSLLCRTCKDRIRRARLRAAVRTTRFALALPSLLFLIVTSLLWAAMFKIAHALSDPYIPPNLTRQLPIGLAWLAPLHLVPSLQFLVYPDNYLKSLQVWSLGYEFPLTLALFFIGFFLLIWWVLPAAVTERFPLRATLAPPRSSTNAETLRMGTWLSRGLDATSTVTFLFWSSIFLLPPVFYLWPEGAGWMHLLKDVTCSIVDNPLLASSGALLGLAVRYGSSILGIVLDVDTYLRAAPTSATPRAKIIERYVSVLKYLIVQRYDSVVIVSHSLGSLISCDLLRYLKMHGELADMGFTPGNIDLRLMTMGNPARQLLNRFFPYLYDWVRDVPDNSLRPLPQAVTKPPAVIPADALPDPADLGVTQWLNLYRSGDYVGRSLWLKEWYCRTAGMPHNGRYPEPIYQAEAGSRLEMCIGAGAHTEYWNDTAPDVAKALNTLIG